MMVIFRKYFFTLFHDLEFINCRKSTAATASSVFQIEFYKSFANGDHANIQYGMDWERNFESRNRFFRGIKWFSRILGIHPKKSDFK